METVKYLGVSEAVAKCPKGMDGRPGVVAWNVTPKFHSTLFSSDGVQSVSYKQSKARIQKNTRNI